MSKAEAIAIHWMRHRSVLIDLLDRFSDEHVNFKPYPTAMSLSELALHMASTPQIFTHLVQTGEFLRPANAPQVETMDDVRRIVHAATENTKASILALSDERLQASVDATATFGFAGPGHTFLSALIDHEVHHKGQLFVYARLVGIDKVPFFVQRQAN